MKSIPLRMEQTAPGRYEGTFDASEVGQYILSLSHKDEQGNLRLHTTGATVPYSPEYRELRANEPLLTRLSDVSGGEVHPALARSAVPTPNSQSPTPDLFRHGGRSRTAPQDLWPLLLLVAALLFPLDVGVRRLMLSPEEILGYARRGADWARTRVPSRAAQPQREQALSRLLAAKERVEAEAQGGGEGAATGAGAASPATAGGAVQTGEAPGGGEAVTAPEAAPPEARSAQPQVVWGRRPPGVEPAPPAGGARPEGGSHPDAQPPAPSAETGGSHTSRLLDARRRAREKPKEEE
jgi:hypothetical protein